MVVNHLSMVRVDSFNPLLFLSIIVLCVGSFSCSPNKLQLPSIQTEKLVEFDTLNDSIFLGKVVDIDIYNDHFYLLDRSVARVYKLVSQTKSILAGVEKLLLLFCAQWVISFVRNFCQDGINLRLAGLLAL